MTSYKEETPVCRLPFLSCTNSVSASYDGGAQSPNLCQPKREKTVGNGAHSRGARGAYDRAHSASRAAAAGCRPSGVVPSCPPTPPARAPTTQGASCILRSLITRPPSLPVVTETPDVRRPVQGQRRGRRTDDARNTDPTGARSTFSEK